MRAHAGERSNSKDAPEARTPQGRGYSKGAPFLTSAARQEEEEKCWQKQKSEDVLTGLGLVTYPPSPWFSNL